MVCENVVNHSHSYRCRFRVMFWQDASPAHIYIFMFVKEVWYVLGVFTMFVCFLEISWHPKQTPRQVPTVSFDPKCSGWIFNRLLYLKVRMQRWWFELPAMTRGKGKWGCVAGNMTPVYCIHLYLLAPHIIHHVILGWSKDSLISLIGQIFQFSQFDLNQCSACTCNM